MGIFTRCALGYVLAPPMWLGGLLLAVGLVLLIWFSSRYIHYDEEDDR